MEKIDKIKKLRINKKSLLIYPLCIGLGGVLGTVVVRSGLHINRDTNLLDFYYINTKDIDISNEELLNEFNKVYESRTDMRNYFGIIYNELCDFIINNGDVLDQEQFLETLPDLKFEVVDDNNLGNDVLAAYRIYQNKILISRSVLSASDKIKKEVMLHEAFHYLFFQGFNNSNSSLFNEGKALDEGTASLLVHEYNSYAGLDDYIKNTYYVKILCELIGKDRYLDCIGHHDLDRLKKYIAKYSSTSEVNKLIKYIDKACDIDNDNLYKIDNEYDELCFEIIKNIYMNKNNISIENSNDSVMKNYCNILFNCDYNLEGVSSQYETIVLKNYFVKKDDTTIAIFEDGVYCGALTVHKNKTLVK